MSDKTTSSSRLTDESALTHLHRVVGAIGRNRGQSQAAKKARRLLAAGADPNYRDGLGKTPLHHLAACDYYINLHPVLNTIRLLLDAGADKTLRDNEGLLPVMCIKTPEQSLVSALLPPGHIGTPPVIGETLFNRVFWGMDERLPPNFAEVCLRFVEAVEKAIPTRPDSCKWRRLIILSDLASPAPDAILRTNPELPLYRDYWGWTPLHWAILADDKTWISRLMEAGADVNAIDSAGLTPLHIAAKVATGSVINDLLKAGALPDFADFRERTPLQALFSRVCESDRISRPFRRLLNAGASPLRRDHQGVSAFTLAFLKHPGLCIELMDTWIRDSSETLVAQVEKELLELNSTCEPAVSDELRREARALDDNSTEIPSDRITKDYPHLWRYIARSESWWNNLPVEIIQAHQEDILANPTCSESLKLAVRMSEI